MLFRSASTTLGNSLVFDNGTNVGIGTTAPGGKLDIRPDTSWAPSEAVIFGSTGQNPALKFYRPTGDGTTAYPWYIRGGGTASDNLEFVTGYTAAIGSESLSAAKVVIQ